MCTKPGMAKNTYGTGSFMLMNTGTEAVPSKNQLVTTIAWRRAGETLYALEGSVFITGAVVQWLRDGLKIIRTSPEIEELALSVPDNGGVYFVPAFVGLGAPHWDAYARATIIALTPGTPSPPISLSPICPTAYQVANVLLAMRPDSCINL